MAKIPKTGFNEAVISIGTGSWQVPEHYKYLVRELRTLGYFAIVPELGTDDESINLEDVAAQMVTAEAETSAENVIRLGHSSALNYVFRQVENIGGIILNAGGVDPQTRKFNKTEAHILPERRNSIEFAAGIEWPPEESESRLTTISKEAAARLIYSGCKQTDVDWAVNLLRGKVRSEDEPEIVDFQPELAIGYIGNVFDLAVEPAYQHLMPRLVFNLQTDWLPTGHSPHIQEPKMEAELVDEIIKRSEPRYHIPRTAIMVADETT